MIKYKKVVLIIPPSPWLISDTDLPFLGILYISSYLKQFRYEVEVCDLSGLREKEWKIPVGDIYGVTGTSPNFIYMNRIINILKEREPNKLVIVGGAHASTYPQHLIENTRADIIVVGQGEEIMLEIAEGCYTGNKYPIIIYENKKEIKDIDRYPIPDLSAIDFYKYAKSQTFKYLLGDVREATLLTARGCPFNCAFCAQHSIFGGHIAYHSLQRIKEEIGVLINEYKVNLIYFLDDTFILDRERVIKICSMIERYYPDLRWHCLSRVDTVDKELLAIMYNSGCVQLVFGFESGSDYILKKINKKTTIEQAYNAIKLVKECNMKVRGQLIVGLPFETKDTVEETANFIRRAKEVDTFGLHMFQPYPGCLIWSSPEQFGYVIEKNTDFKDYHTIGNPDETLTYDYNKQEWFDYLKQVIGDRNIEKQGALIDK
ncbi:MAG: hypothetical protein A3K77_00615 [Euryarchaeota archaeon RBG_13_31_8]|nr:MAG: hypothetical protein A3K77_00615 [Euryarchaeota archaeon RBG_13_31_8]